MQKIMMTFLLLDVYPSFTIESMLILCRRKGNEAGFIISKQTFLQNDYAIRKMSSSVQDPIRIFFWKLKHLTVL